MFTSYRCYIPNNSTTTGRSHATRMATLHTLYLQPITYGLFSLIGAAHATLAGPTFTLHPGERARE